MEIFQARNDTSYVSKSQIMKRLMCPLKKCELHAFMESFELASEMIRSVLLKEHWQHLDWDKTRDRDSSEGAMVISRQEMTVA